MGDSPYDQERMMARLVIELVKRLGGVVRIPDHVMTPIHSDDTVTLDHLPGELVLRLNRDDTLASEIEEAVDSTKRMIIELEQQ